jgi:hypothetical protein
VIVSAGVGAPGGPDVYVTEQRASPSPTSTSEHECSLKLPAPLDAKWTAPAGVRGVPPAVSVTVAEHVAGCPTATASGEQPTRAEVERSVTASAALCDPPVWAASPR